MVNRMWNWLTQFHYWDFLKAFGVAIVIVTVVLTELTILCTLVGNFWIEYQHMVAIIHQNDWSTQPPPRPSSGTCPDNTPPKNSRHKKPSSLKSHPAASPDRDAKNKNRIKEKDVMAAHQSSHPGAPGKLIAARLNP